MKSSNPANLHLVRPEESPNPLTGESTDDLPADDDLVGPEAWLLADGLPDDGVEETVAGPPTADPFGRSDGVGTPARADLIGMGADRETAISVSSRLEAVLRGAAEGFECDGAALYTLDTATTELAMRSMWALAPSRLIEDARPLRGAIADLEAMCGHAVVLEDDMMNAYWRVPEPCAAAVCLPVATASTVLGTLWFFFEMPRQIGDKTTNLMEIVAGRLAVELELEELRDAHRAGLWSWKAPSESSD